MWFQRGLECQSLAMISKPCMTRKDRVLDRKYSHPLYNTLVSNKSHVLWEWWLKTGFTRGIVAILVCVSICYESQPSHKMMDIIMPPSLSGA